MSDQTGRECIINLTSGLAIACPAYPAEAIYMRVIDGDKEVAYWDEDELSDDPAHVIRLFFNMLERGQDECDSKQLETLTKERFAAAQRYLGRGYDRWTYRQRW